MAGFPGRQGNYFLPQAKLTLPAGLQQLVWPWLETWVKHLKERARGKKSECRGLDTDDLTLLGFVELLGELRIVFLQDATVLQRQFPGSLLWTVGLSSGQWGSLCPCSGYSLPVLYNTAWQTL